MKQDIYIYIYISIELPLLLIPSGPGPGRAPCAGVAGPFVRGAGGQCAVGPLRNGPAHAVAPGPGPGPVQEGVDSYSAQEGINSRANIVDI